MTDDPMCCYLANPIVSCRDEGDDGALLYNPDIDDAILINTTGRIIWEFMAKPHTFDEIRDHLASIIDSVSEGQIAKDLEQFLKDLMPEFVSEVMPSESGGI